MSEITIPKSVADTSPALEWRSDDYPNRFKNRVPLKVKAVKTVRPAFPCMALAEGSKEPAICLRNQVYFAWVNSYGAVSAILPSGDMIGLLPSEFEVVECHINSKIDPLVKACCDTLFQHKQLRDVKDIVSIAGIKFYDSPKDQKDIEKAIEKAYKITGFKSPVETKQYESGKNEH